MIIQFFIIIQQMLRENQNEEILRPQSILTSSESNNKIYYLIEAFQKQLASTLLQCNETSAKFQCFLNTQQKQSSKILVNLAIKNHLLQIKCFLLLIEAELKYAGKIMTQALNTFNQELMNSIFLRKIYFDPQEKTMIVQGYTSSEMGENFGRHEFYSQFKFAVRKSFQILKEIQYLISAKKKQNHLIQDIKKAKEIFEENRIKREKSTKICLLEETNKIVNFYKGGIESNSNIIRPLYQKFKEQKQKCQSNDAMRKFLQKAKKQKKGDENQEFIKIIKKPILKPICIFQQSLIQVLEPGGFGEVYKCKCIFEQLDTVTSDSQRYIEQQRIKLDINLERNQMLDILVRKNAKPSYHSKESLDIQYNCLKYLKNEECSQIAQYYIIIEKKQRKSGNYPSIYSKFYEYKLADFQKQSSEVQIKIMLDLIEGINFIMNNKLLHRDLKPDNIRLTNKRKVKIIDFGSACLSYGNEKLSSVLEKACDRFYFSKGYTLEFHKARLNNMSFEQFTRHPLYDLYAYGKIMSNFFEKNVGDIQVIIDSMNYLSQKSMQANPQDRLNPQEISIFLRLVLKVLSFYMQI